MTEGTARPAVERISAAAAEDGQRRVAGGLAARGVCEGDRIAFLCGNSVHLLVALLGALRAGIVPVPLSPSLLPAERALLLEDAQPALVVDDDEGLESLVSGPPRDLAPVPRCRPMHYTSGTTGRPKGVWSGILDDAAALALHEDEASQWGFAGSDRLLVCSPLYHSAPLRFATATLLAGGDVTVLSRFDAATVVDVVAADATTVAFMVPAHLQRLFAADSALPVASFRLLAHAGAPCPEPLKRRAIAAFPRGSVWEFYGSTEGQFTACATDEWLARPGTVGRARAGRRITVDGEGVVWCEVPSYARFEYWRDPERTAAAWRDGAFTVGDIGRLDDDGYLFLDGRRDDLIISGGVNVYPVEVEQALASLPGVDDVAVFGVADQRWGQRVCAAVVGPATPAQVLAGARERLAAYKRPKDVYVVAADALPRTGTGKLRRSALARQLGLET